MLTLCCEDPDEMLQNVAFHQWSALLPIKSKIDLQRQR